MTEKWRKPRFGRIGDGCVGPSRPIGAKMREARDRRWSPRADRPPHRALFDDRARALLLLLMIAIAFCGLSGLVAPRTESAFASDGYTHVFPNGKSVVVHADGRVTGTCVMTGNALLDGKFRGTVTMPDGNSYTAYCYEEYIGAPNHGMYPGPGDGTYPFEAARNPDGTYFVLIKSQDASHGAPGTLPSTYPYQRCYTKEWRLVLDVEVSFVKRSGKTSITDGNGEYALGGAAFDIYDAATETKVATIATDEGGGASCRLAPNKRYYAVETKAPTGFIVHRGRLPFTVNATGCEVVLENEPGTVTIAIRKRDAASGDTPQPGTSLKGARYEVASLSTPGWKTSATTDDRGTVTVTGIPLGKIAVTEIEAPEGYEIDPTVHTYEVRAGQLGADGTVELTPQDSYAEVPRAFDLELVKYLESGNESSGLQKPGVGVRFLIISNSTKKAVGSITTDDRGRASTVGEWFGQGSRVDGIKGALPYDAKGYTIREDPESTPAGYQPCPDWTIGTEQMANGVVLSYIIDNDFVGSRIQIAKHDAESGRTVPLAGFAFQVLDKNKHLVTQEIWHPNHSVLDTFTTDGTGCVTLPEPLEPGTYFVREIRAVRPYLTNGDDIEFHIEDESETEPITVVRIADERARGRASIVKRCAEEGCPWCNEGDGLAGASFNIIALENISSPDGTVQAVEGAVVGTVVTGDDRVGHVDDLPLGKGSARYAFVETAASPGHRLDSTPVPFTLTWKDPETRVVLAEAELENSPTRVVIDKVDATTGEALQHARFDVWPRQLEHEPIDSGTGMGSLLITKRFDGWAWGDLEVSLMRERGDGKADSDEDGRFGKHQGGRPDYTLEDFSIDDDVAAIAGISPGNYLLNVSLGDERESMTLRLSVEANGTAHAHLGSDGLRTSGHTLAPGRQRQLDAALKRLGIPTSTDEQGQIELKHLPAFENELLRLLDANEKTNGDGEKRIGDVDARQSDDGKLLTWCIQETEAPNGYVVDHTVRTFAVPTTTDDDGASRISLKNDFTKIEIEKRSSATEEPLEGAQLEVTDAAGNTIDRWTSSEEPHRIERLRPGMYTLSELAPPQTHDQAEPLTFIVKPTADVQTVTMYDEKISIGGRIDKRQEIVRPTAANARVDGDALNRAEATESEDGAYSYTIDYRNDSSTWVDEFTVEDNLIAAEKGMAELTGITTGRAQGDRDGRLNIWYRTNIEDDETDSQEANATISDGHGNPWLDDPSVIEKIGDDGRSISYDGWRLWADGVPTDTSTHLDVDELGLESGERVTGIRLEYGSVSKGFATRNQGWDEAGIKDAHDDWNPIPVEYPGEGDEGGAGAPTIVHMKALDTYAGGCALDNHARVALYRNGGGDGLEAHDDDSVHQEAGGVPIAMLLDQTGSYPIARAAASFAVVAGAVSTWIFLRKGGRRAFPQTISGMRRQRRGGSGLLGGRRPPARWRKIPRTFR